MPQVKQRGHDPTSGPDISALVEAQAEARAAAEPTAAGGGSHNGADKVRSVPEPALTTDSSMGLDSSGSFKPLESKPSTGSETGSEPSSGANTSADMSPHYDATRDVVLRLEFIRPTEFKAIIRSVMAAVVAGMVILIVAVYMKVDRPDSYYIQNNLIPITNLSFAGVLCPALLVACCMFYYRVYRSNLSGKRWSHRRRRAVNLARIEISLQLINCIFFIIPNGWVLTHDCAWFHPLVLWSGFVRWSIWNTLFLMFVVQAHSANPAVCPRWRKYVTRADGAVMDAPLHAHWPKLILWAVSEAILLALTLLILTTSAPGNVPLEGPGVTDCTQREWNCHFTDSTLTLLVLNVSTIISYFLLWVFFMARAFNNLQHLPYNAMRMANLTTRIQVKQRGLSITFFVLCIICYAFVNLNTCSSYIFSWLGFLPMQVVMAATAIANAYICMPKRPRDAGVLQVWLQEFAWLERDVPAKKEERASSLPPDSYEGFCLDCEPLWCFETAVKMMYWSFLVYDYQEDKGAPSHYSPDTALLLYDLDNFECMWEKSLDTKAVVGWNDDTVVIAFRGTSSMANVRADLQAWRTRWPPGVGSIWTRTAPMVHKGFHASYTANGFNDKLLARLEHILFRCANQQKEAGTDKPVNVYVTGHSLGGALATLCAYDIKKRCPCAEYMINIKCYTFGSPRVGNHAFVKLYNEAVPDTWHMINNEDLVTKAAKFWALYKRGGHRVLINKLGDLVVRPSYVETAIRGVPGGASVRDHLLTQYQKALMAVIAGQFGGKSFADGKDGVLSLAEQRGVSDVLHMGGLTSKEMKVLRERGWDAYQRLVRHQAAKVRRSKHSRLRKAMSRHEETVEVPVPQLQAIVVHEVPLSEGESEAASEPTSPGAPPSPGAAGAHDSALAAAAAGAPDLEAGAPIVSEERDGVLHTTQMNCRDRRKRRCQTICSMIHRPAGAAVKALPAAPEEDAPPTPVGQQALAQEMQLHSVAEEDGEHDSPPSTPGTPSTPSQPATRRHRQQPSWWRRQKEALAAMVGWNTSAASSFLSRATSTARSLATSSTMSLSPATSDTSSHFSNTRGSFGDAPAFPLVLDVSGGGGSRRHGGLPATAEELSARALEAHAAEAAAATNKA